MTDDSGTLSIDFIAGFTIFLLAFIWVLSMIPGLLVNLQGYTIDYDAVAYRTGVILVEDPGYPVSPPWESQQNFSVTRFGLAVSRDTPNILSQEKVERFFCATSVYGSFSYPDDYHQRVIFGDYPYRFNISLLDVEGNKLQSVGDVIPDGRGYIRRIVKIKGLSNATINESYIKSHAFINPDNNATSHDFSILVNNAKLREQRNPAYEIDPSRDQIMVNITDLRSTLITDPANANSVNITLTKINVYKVDAGVLSLVRTFNTPYIDGNSSTTIPSSSSEVRDNITLKFSPAFFDILNAGNAPVYINLSFNLSMPLGTPYPSRFLNNTWSSPFEYNYNPANVTQPRLRDAMVEVAVW